MFIQDRNGKISVGVDISVESQQYHQKIEEVHYPHNPKQVKPKIEIQALNSLIQVKSSRDVRGIELPFSSGRFKAYKPTHLKEGYLSRNQPKSVSRKYGIQNNSTIIENNRTNSPTDKKQRNNSAKGQMMSIFQSSPQDVQKVYGHSQVSSKQNITNKRKIVRETGGTGESQTIKNQKEDERVSLKESEGHNFKSNLKKQPKHRIPELVADNSDRSRINTPEKFGDLEQTDFHTSKNHSFTELLENGINVVKNPYQKTDSQKSASKKVDFANMPASKIHKEGNGGCNKVLMVN